MQRRLSLVMQRLLDMKQREVESARQQSAAAEAAAESLTAQLVALQVPPFIHTCFFPPSHPQRPDLSAPNNSGSIR